MAIVRVIQKCFLCVRSLLISVAREFNFITWRSLKRFLRPEGIFYLLTVLIILAILNSIKTYNNKGTSAVRKKPSNFNYFIIPPSTDDVGLLVNTTECKIPDLGPWDPSILTHIAKMHPHQFACDTKIPHWTYVNGTNLIMNRTAIEKSGYRPEDLDCCYQSIRRVEQDPNNYDHWADRLVRYSNKCYSMKLVTPILTAEHIHVTCRFRYQIWMDEASFPVLYKNFHLIAQPNRNRVEQIVQYWKIKESEHAHPPNVIVIGLDSTSRLNFRRGMFQTQKILEQIGAHEMMGYTKVAENTYGNGVPFLSGYTIAEMEKLCRPHELSKFDDCPIIWRDFKGANYLTASVEDTPGHALFHIDRTGFVVQPTDFISRPVMLAAQQAVMDYPEQIGCVGYTTVEQFLLKFIKEVIELSKSKNSPLFLFSWFTELAHDGPINKVQTADQYYASFLQELMDKDFLDNSILFFMSDHGYRYGAVRNTLSGWYEDRLPNMWIWLSQNIKQKYPQWEVALIRNKRMLSSPYDLHNTFVHILQTFSNSTVDTYPTTPRIYGQSFFQPIPENRTCANAGIPENYCACVYPSKINLADPVIQQAARFAIEEINKSLPPQCIKFTLSQVVGGALTSSSNDAENDGITKEKLRKYVVNFETNPGWFLYEATVQYKQFGNETFEVAGIIQRLSQFNTDLSCVNDANTKLYCYCDPNFQGQ